jgi:predicted transcriptional regulator
MAASAELLQQLLALGEPERVEIAQALLDSVDHGDGLSDTDRRRLDAAIDLSLAQIDAGETIPFDEVMASLRARRARRTAH